MPKHKDQTHADKPQGGAKGSAAADTGLLEPGTIKGSGPDISGKHPPTYYDEIDTADRDEEAEESR